MYIVILIMLLIILSQHAKEGKYYFVQHRLFRLLVVSLLVVTIIDLISWLLNGQYKFLWPQLVTWGNLLVLACYLMPFLLWILFVDFEVYGQIKRLKPRLLFYIIPLLIVGVHILLRPYHLHFFIISENGRFYRGNGPLLFNLIGILLLAYTAWFVLKHWRIIYWRNRWALLMFSILPLITLLIQAKNGYFNLLWASFSLSVLIIYITMQNKAVKTDYLTGFYNRRHLESFLTNKLNNLQTDQVFTVIMIDLYELCSINDEFGHTSGDRALDALALIIRSVFAYDDFIARYSGHKFVILSDIADEKMLEKKINDLNEHIALFNEKKREPFDLRIKLTCEMISQEIGIKSMDLLAYLESQITS